MRFQRQEIGRHIFELVSWLSRAGEKSMIHTALTERYGLEVPFVSAGMGFIALPTLAAAISNAGGFGQLACGTAPPAVLHKMIAATRERTSRPFGVNLIIEPQCSAR
jgi:NAD(P)H-dependent flavin oxidoreductase YrpB (nitropropane dioxygenase family)